MDNEEEILDHQNTSKGSFEDESRSWPGTGPGAGRPCPDPTEKEQNSA